MANRNAEKGKRWERSLARGFRESGLDTERLRLTGTLDEGDLSIRVGHRHFICEAKDTKLNVTGFLNEAEVEAVNYAKTRGLPEEWVFPFVTWKRRGSSFKGGAVILDMDTWLRILDALGGK